MPVKITSLEIENVKRVKALQLTPAENGLTTLGGRNNQGKTSVLDAIAFALGGERYRPTNLTREGSVLPPRLHVELSNGLIVERSGQKSALKVTDPTGRKAGQQLLNSFVEQFALDLPRFLAASDREKADTLLRIIGVGDQLEALERDISRIYTQRTYVGQQQRQKAQYAAGLPSVPDAPEQEVSASELVQHQQDILARNGENQRKRRHLAALTEEAEKLADNIALLQQKLEEVQADLAVAAADAADLVDESTAELEADLRRVDEINQAVRVNAAKRRAQAEADALAQEYDDLSAQLEQARTAKTDLLNGANLPLPGLSVENGALRYQGKAWDSMSGSDQLRVATAIVRRLNPNCGFILLDKLEQMDSETLRSFGEWLEQEGLQAIATRVSTGDECSVIIEDGLAVPQPQQAAAKPTAWQKGVF
ncbi:MAG: AAA family ATPase [Clostridiales bacterium]|nr:AAA family ATPase [Clostridiales bacterium]